MITKINEHFFFGKATLNGWDFRTDLNFIKRLYTCNFHWQPVTKDEGATINAQSTYDYFKMNILYQVQEYKSSTCYI